MKAADRDRISGLCEQMCETFSIVSVSRMNSDKEIEDIIYEVHLKRGVDYDELVGSLSKAVDPLSISVLVGEGTVNA